MATSAAEAVADVSCVVGLMSIMQRHSLPPYVEQDTYEQ